MSGPRLFDSSTPALAQTQPGPGLDDQVAAIHFDDALGLAQDHLDDARVLVGGLRGDLLRERRGGDVAEARDASLGLRDDLLADDDDVAGRRAAGRRGRARASSSAGEIVARLRSAGMPGIGADA